MLQAAHAGRPLRAAERDGPNLDDLGAYDSLPAVSVRRAFFQLAMLTLTLTVTLTVTLTLTLTLTRYAAPSSSTP